MPVAAFGAGVVCLYYPETSAVHLVNQWVSLSKFDRAIDVGVLALQLPACAATAEFGLEGIFSAELEPVELLEEGEAAEDPTFCCFAAGTPVHTDHGNVPVEKISVGDKVYSRNRTTGTTELRSVTALTPQHRDKLVELRIEGERAALRPSLDHPFWAKKDLSDPGHWIIAANLAVGELLETLDGGWRKIESLTPVDGQQTVYNFTVDKDHDYFVGETGFLVHNAGNCGCKPSPVNFGNRVHQYFGPVLQALTGTGPGDWIMNTAPGVTGVDGIYVGPPETNPGFNFAELKPVGYPDNAVGSQIGRWNLPEGETCIFWYNSNGIIGQTLGRW